MTEAGISKKIKGINTNQITYAKMRELLNSIEGVSLNDAKNGSFKFPVYVSDKCKDIGIDVLELSVRSSHCLMRMGYSTLDKLYANVNSLEDLKKIRNCGTNSAREIMEKIFLYQYNSLKPEKRNGYLMRVIELNMKDDNKTYK